MKLTNVNWPVFVVAILVLGAAGVLRGMGKVETAFVVSMFGIVVHSFLPSLIGSRKAKATVLATVQIGSDPPKDGPDTDPAPPL